jgi:hypothetical protein
MKSPVCVVRAGLVVVTAGCLASAALPGAARAMQAPASGSDAPAPGTPQYLPDTTVMLRVGDRVVRASDFVRDYFNAWPVDRPASDSAGRVEFLNQVTKKEILATVALQANRPMGFEERVVMRAYTQRMLSNILFERLVTDSIQVTDEDIEALRRQYSCEKDLKQILFSDLATAERVRADLVAKRITWADAHRRYCKQTHDEKSKADGDFGWVRRDALSPEDAVQIFDPEPGGISPPQQSSDGVRLVLVSARRPAEPSSLKRIDSVLRREIRQLRTAERAQAIHARLGRQIGLTFVDSNLVWTSSKFPAPPPAVDSLGRVHMRRISFVPNFAPQDTGRILARWRDGRLSLDGFMTGYRQANPFVRNPVNTPELLRENVEATVLEPYQAEMAHKLRLDKDPLAVALIQQKREGILVDHLYQDSVMTRVVVTPAERRKYYDQHIVDFITYPTARYAEIRAPNRSAADSIAARLRAGEPAEQILRADSIRYGFSVGWIRNITTQEPGLFAYKIVMEELKPGQVSVEVNPDIGYEVFQTLSFDPGRQLPYNEVEANVDESVQNLAAEKILKELIARHRARLRIEAHPELVMRINFKDPLDRDD